MKATERHRLKTNELADSLSDMLDYMRRHGSVITTGAIVALLVIFGGLWWWDSHVSAQLHQSVKLQGLMGDLARMQAEAAYRAQAEETADNEASLMPDAYNPAPVVNSLGALTEDSAGTPVGMVALMQQAEAIRSQLLFSDNIIFPDQRAELCGRAETLYKRIAQEYGDVPLAVGTSQLGLALIAEERGQWEQARGLYEQMIAQADGKLAATVFPRQAQRRLEILDEISTPIVFPIKSLAPEPILSPESVTELDYALPRAGSDETGTAPSDQADQTAPAETAQDSQDQTNESVPAEPATQE